MRHGAFLRLKTVKKKEKWGNNCGIFRTKKTGTTGTTVEEVEEVEEVREVKVEMRRHAEL
jgi:hypothetical protein